MSTGTTLPLAGTVLVASIFATVARSVWPGRGPPVSWPQAVWTVGKYPTQRFSINPAHSADIGTASTDTPRRHQRAERQPNAATPAARPVSPTQIHSGSGAGSPESPLDAMFQYVTAMKVNPTTAAVGSQASRHRRSRHPMAYTSASTARSCMVTGIQPCISEMCPRNGQLGSARIVVAASPIRDVGKGVTPTIVAGLPHKLSVTRKMGPQGSRTDKVSAAWPVGRVASRGYFVLL